MSMRKYGKYERDELWSIDDVQRWSGDKWM